MIFKTPPFSVNKVGVVGALFKAQLPDTLNAIRQVIPDWAAVHVVLQPGIRRGPGPDEIRAELVAQLKPLATLYDPAIHTLTSPEIPPDTIATFVPDRVRPTFAPEHQGWKFVHLGDARALLAELFDRALGGIPEGYVGVADALVKGTVRGQTALEGWTGSLGAPAYKRTMESLIDPEGPVLFWDSAFGFETTGAQFLKSTELILGMLDSKHDRLYFDAKDFSWFVVFYPGGQMRAAMLG